MMLRYRYRVEKEINGRMVRFNIVLRAGSAQAATLMAGEIGMTLGLLLIGPI